MQCAEYMKFIGAQNVHYTLRCNLQVWGAIFFAILGVFLNSPFYSEHFAYTQVG